MGYAAGCCPHFRPGAGDAVRFSIGPAATVRWLVVSGALPEQSGEVRLDEVDGETVLPGIPSIISTQLKAYVAAFRESRPDSVKQEK
jgi:hypothetical protein